MAIVASWFNPQGDARHRPVFGVSHYSAIGYDFSVSQTTNLSTSSYQIIDRISPGIQDDRTCMRDIDIGWRAGCMILRHPVDSRDFASIERLTIDLTDFDDRTDSCITQGETARLSVPASRDSELGCARWADEESSAASVVAVHTASTSLRTAEELRNRFFRCSHVASACAPVLSGRSQPPVNHQ